MTHKYCLTTRIKNVGTASKNHGLQNVCYESQNHNSWYDEDKSEYLTDSDSDSCVCTDLDSDSSTAAVAAEY